jgi:hypothetical protein
MRTLPRPVPELNRAIGPILRQLVRLRHQRGTTKRGQGLLAPEAKPRGEESPANIDPSYPSTAGESHMALESKF